MQQKQRYILTVVFGGVVSLIGGIIGVASLLDAIGVIRHTGSTAQFAVTAAVSLCIAAVGAVLAIHAEHQLHHLPGGPSAWAANEGWRTSNPNLKAGGRRRVHSPGSMVVLALFFLGITAFMVFATLQAHSDAERSSYTQNHGVRESALVDDVQNIAHHSSHGGTNYSFEITVTVRHPAIGDGSATIYGQGMTSVQNGETITVLVDPHQTDYAEIPGSPYYTSLQWLLGLVIGIIFAALTVATSRRAAIMVLRHRRVSASPLHLVKSN
jgi:hypothetical protein